ncbi:MAG: DinB family protein [bacterium]|nr:MAG: DinB family protein [bacterium]
MMITELIHTFESTVKYVEQSVADLSEQQMVEQPSGVPNHGTWTLGHIIHSCQGVAAELGAENWLPDDWESVFGYGSTPSSDLSSYPEKSEMLTLLTDAANRLRRIILASNDSVLSKSLPDDTLPTMGHLLMQVVVAHTAYHAGQLTVWRRAIGKQSVAVFI